ncbi:hypothetical protein [Ekhidna sp.]|uniref:hypothetical protein n=1 Tax=Ekhidna sp. TaxID=2608089 RepID=UPI00351353BC
MSKKILGGELTHITTSICVFLMIFWPTLTIFFYWRNPQTYVLIICLIGTLFFFSVYLIYRNFVQVRLEGDTIVVAKIFKKKVYEKSDFLSVQPYLVPLVYKITLKDDSYFFLANHTDFLKSLFKRKYLIDKITNQVGSTA